MTLFCHGLRQNRSKRSGRSSRVGILAAFLRHGPRVFTIEIMMKRLLLFISLLRLWFLFVIGSG